MIKIRKAKAEQLAEILEIYEYAREFMRKTGNPDQWGTTYPEKELLIDDIAKGQLYTGLDETGKVHLVFAFVEGDEPTYWHIEDGSWPDNNPYGTIHRIAGDGQIKGLFTAGLDYCKSRTANIRIDTHENNKIMQHLIEKNGFKKCGTIYVEDGSPRIAYQYTG